MVYARKGTAVRLFYLAVSMLIWLFSFGGRLFGSNRVILCYHGITDSNARDFRRQMLSVANRVVALDAPWPDNQVRSLPPAVVVTFDDAFENLLTNAMPIINDQHIPVSIYVVTGYMGDRPGWLKESRHDDEHRRLMSREQIVALADNALVSFGIHTHTHPNLTNLDRNSVKHELCKSRYLLESLVGQAVYSLAFPHGAFDAEVTEVAASCGLTKLLTLEEQMLHAKQHHGEMGRFSMEPGIWPIEFRLTVDGAYSWLYYFRRTIRYLRNTLAK